jgi:hypothetical protein
MYGVGVEGIIYQFMQAFLGKRRTKFRQWKLVGGKIERDLIERTVERKVLYLGISKIEENRKIGASCSENEL